jgi:transcriptional regulator with XRE-family HTH domain
MSKKVDYLIFRNNITKIRSSKGWTAKDLSEKAELRQLKRISDIEDGRGSPNLEEVCSICRVLGYPIDKMLYHEANVTITFNSNRQL